MLIYPLLYFVYVELRAMLLLKDVNPDNDLEFLYPFINFKELIIANLSIIANNIVIIITIMIFLSLGSFFVFINNCNSDINLHYFMNNFVYKIIVTNISHQVKLMLHNSSNYL